MKKNIMMFVSIVMILICAFVITSCRVPGPDIGYPSVHYLTETQDTREANLYWDYENRAKPFTVSIKKSTDAEYEDIETVEVPPVARELDKGVTYNWKVEGGNGSTGGEWSFTVPE